MRHLLLVLLAAVTAAPPALGDDPGAGTPQAADPTPIRIEQCEVSFEQTTDIGAFYSESAPLVLQDMNVRLGERVKAGQVLGRLHDRDLKAVLEQKKIQAESDIEVRLAEAKKTEAVLRLTRATNLRKQSKSFVSEEEFAKLRTEAESAVLQAELAKHNLKVAQLEYQALDTKVKDREIVSPHDGVVVEVYKKVGETVLPGGPVFQVVNTSLLQVTGFLNLEDFGRVSEGQPVEISSNAEEIDPFGKSWSFTGKVTFVDSRFDPKTRTCKVVAQVVNPGKRLASGFVARMDILPQKIADKGTAPAPEKPASSPVNASPAEPVNAVAERRLN